MADLRSRIEVAQLAESRQNFIGRLLQNAARAVSVQGTERLRARGEAVRSGLPGVAYIRTDSAVPWPPTLQGKVAQ